VGNRWYESYPTYSPPRTPSLLCDEQTGVEVGIGIFLNFLRKQVVEKARRYIESKSTTKERDRP